MYCVRVTINGIVIRDKTVEMETIFTERSVAFPNFEENIVVTAAVGAQAEIESDTSNVLRIPQRYSKPITATGNTISLNAIANNPCLSLSPSISLDCAKWKPIIIIGRGVLSEAI